MAEDHYISQTYLRRFAGGNGMLRAYRKFDGSSFPCWPKDICRETNGDIIPDFLSDPHYLGAYRGAFEPVWNKAVDAFSARAPDLQSKMNIAGYWAQLLVCTPTWRRVAVEMSNHRSISTVRAYYEQLKKRGKIDEKLGEAIKAVDSGEVIVETDPNFVRAQAAANVLTFAWAIYNAEWKAFESDTDVDFITSDNPAAFKDQGDAPSGSLPFLRFLPITPRLCLMCDLTEHHNQLRKTAVDFTNEPIGGVRGGVAEPTTVEKINGHVATCAEELVFCGGESAYAQELARRYSRFRVEFQPIMIPSPRGYIIGSRTRAVERAH